MKFRGKYGFLSNFYECDIWWEGIRFRSVENAFQAGKSNKRNDWVKISTVSPAMAKKLGRKVDLIDHWDDIKEIFMLKLLYKKFADPELAKMLIDVNEEIVEDNTWGDKYWGVCNGEGKNVLGSLLMEVRDSLLEDREYTKQRY